MSKDKRWIIYESVVPLDVYIRYMNHLKHKKGSLEEDVSSKSEDNVVEKEL